MRNGLSAGPLPNIGLPYASEISRACALEATFSPLVAYAIKVNETADMPNAATVISGDGGHGLFQLTSSYPDDWDDPYANAVYAIDYFLYPSEAFWAAKGMQGDDLVRCIAAEFNAGRGGAESGHAEGDVGKYTTDHYDRRALDHYHALQQGRSPF